MLNRVHVAFSESTIYLYGHDAASVVPLGTLYEELGENVLVPLELRGNGTSEGAAAELLARVGLGDRLDHYPSQLSGGEQQRVALARAFVMRPALLLADEPTGSLDFATGETVMQLMFDLNRELGTTLVLVTHDRSIAARCEQRITIEAGRVAAG